MSEVTYNATYDPEFIGKVPWDTEMERVTLDYDLADKLMYAHETNDHPPRLEDSYAQYVEDMLNGEWISDYDQRSICIVGPNGWTYDGIYFPPGTIIDGWHRINAVIDAEFTQPGISIQVYLEYVGDDTPAVTVTETHE